MVELQPKPRQIFIIDYGLAKLYKDQKKRTHIPFREGKKLTGTARYASIYTHQGFEQSRRDDLECLGYVLVYFAKGGLPWQGIREGNADEKYNRILLKKKNTSIESLCKNLPVEFIQYLYYTRAIGFEDKPDYIRLKKLFKDLFIKKVISNEFDYDWNETISDVRKVGCSYKLFEIIEPEELRSGKKEGTIAISQIRKIGGPTKAGEEEIKRINTTKSLGVALRIEMERKCENAEQIEDSAIDRVNTIKVQREATLKKEAIAKAAARAFKGSLKRVQDDSCNFDLEDLIEDHSLLGIVNDYDSCR